MGKNYSSTEAKCPFYKWEEGKRVCCEGISPDMSIVLVFTGKAERAEEHKDRFCKERWNDCPISKMLWEMYKL